MFYDNYLVETNYRDVTSIEDAKKKLEKIKRGRSATDFMDWFKHILKLFTLGGGWLHLALLGISDFMAMPGSAKDKVRRINQLINAVEKQITKYEIDDDRESKKAVSDYKTVLKTLETEREKLIKNQEIKGSFLSNFKESTEDLFNF